MAFYPTGALLRGLEGLRGWEAAAATARIGLKVTVTA